MSIVRKINKKIKNFKRSRNKVIPIYELAGIDNLLNGKTAIITGGGSGIGLAIAKNFSKAGCKVILVGSNETKLKVAQKELEADIKTIDLRSYEAIVNGLNDLFSYYNNIDILVNSAGVGQKGNFLTITEDEYDRIMDINMKGMFFICQEFAKHLIDKGQNGNILNISSSSSLKPAWGPYQISKWGVRGFTIGLAKSLLPYGITVNGIAPGKTATVMMGFEDDFSNILCEKNQPSGRYIMPEEVANLALFLVSELGKQIIGDTVFITGGNGIIEL